MKCGMLGSTEEAKQRHRRHYGNHWLAWDERLTETLEGMRHRRVECQGSGKGKIRNHWQFQRGSVSSEVAGWMVRGMTEERKLKCDLTRGGWGLRYSMHQSNVWEAPWTRSPPSLDWCDLGAVTLKAFFAISWELCSTKHTLPYSVPVNPIAEWRRVGESTALPVHTACPRAHLCSKNLAESAPCVWTSKSRNSPRTDWSKSET